MERTIRHYLLLDPQQNDPAMEGESQPRRALEQLTRSVPARAYLLGGKGAARPREELVRLYALEEGDELWKASQSWVISEPGRVSVCGWLQSRFSLQELGRYLDRLLIQQHPSQGQVHFRYFDPRTLHHLAHILTPHQLESLLGLVVRWEYVGINGERQTLNGPGTLKGKFVMDSTQWASVERLSTINLCLRGWRHNVSPAPLPTRASVQVEHFLKLAEEYGLCEEAELIAFVLHGLATSDRFDQHPLMTKVLRKCQDNGISYLSLTESFTEEDWMAISGKTFKEKQV